MVLGLLLIFMLVILWLKKKFFLYSANVLMAVWILLFLLIGYGVIPHFLSKKIQSAYASSMPTFWGGNNIIVLLGSGIVNVSYGQGVNLVHQQEVGFFAYGRMAKALVLYYQCKREKKSCKVLITGGDVDKAGISEAALYSTYLQSAGIDKQDIFEEPKSLNTWENAKFSAELLKHQHFDRLVLVSSGMHLKRSLLYFSHFNLHPIGIRADFLAEKYSFLPLAFNFVVMDYVLHEYVGILKYYIYCAAGLND